MGGLPGDGGEQIYGSQLTPLIYIDLANSSALCENRKFDDYYHFIYTCCVVLCCVVL